MNLNRRTLNMIEYYDVLRHTYVYSVIKTTLDLKEIDL